jgi:hypothetical protein
MLLGSGGQPLPLLGDFGMGTELLEGLGLQDFGSLDFVAPWCANLLRFLVTFPNII